MVPVTIQVLFIYNIQPMLRIQRTRPCAFECLPLPTDPLAVRLRHSPHSARRRHPHVAQRTSPAGAGGDAWRSNGTTHNRRVGYGRDTEVVGRVDVDVWRTVDRWWWRQAGRTRVPNTAVVANGASEMCASKTSFAELLFPRLSSIRRNSANCRCAITKVVTCRYGFMQ